MRNQTRREFIKTVGSLAASTGLSIAMPGCAGISKVQRAQSNRPNIVFFFADDMRFDTIHSLGNEEIITPTLDSLVRNGTAFTNAYIMGSMSGAVCIPSRAMLLSGRTLFHLQSPGRVIPPEHITLPRILYNAGYRTFHIGKWHQDQPTYARCFSDGAKIFFGGMTDQFNVPVYDFDPGGKYPNDKRYIESGKHSSELFSDAAISFLRNYKEEKPFFLYIAYTAPHDPREMPKQYGDMYAPAKVVLPKSFMAEHPFDNGDLKVRDEALAPWPRTPDEIRRHIAAYYAMITHLDAQIGRVLDVLKETGYAQNTIVIFAADNGLALGRHGLMGKQNIYEHSVHVPLVITGPGIPKDKKRNCFCYLLDIYPTLCDLVGVPVPDSVEGQSFVTIIRGQKSNLRDALFFAYKDFQRGIRNERYKLIEYSVNGKRMTQLFDLQSDPWEISNLAGNRRYAENFHRLRSQLLKWKDKLGDKSSFWQDYDATL
jgi:arylsulfatase A-like enzyme